MKIIIEFLHSSSIQFCSSEKNCILIYLDDEYITPDEQIMNYLMKGLTLNNEDDIECICSKKDVEMVSALVNPYGFSLSTYE